MTLKILSIDRVLIKKHFYVKNHVEKLYQKLATDPSFILVNNSKQQLHARN